MELIFVRINFKFWSKFWIIANKVLKSNKTFVV